MKKKTPLEIERKWMVNGFPDLPLLFTQQMRQGYIATHPTVRIREEKMIYSSKDQPLKDEFILCFKSSGLLTRKEIEMKIPEEKPEATFTLNDGDEVVAAYELCNLHGLWKAE